MASNRLLRSLCLGENGITNVASLADVLKSNRSLTALSLFLNQIVDISSLAGTQYNPLLPCSPYSNMHNLMMHFCPLSLVLCSTRRGSTIKPVPRGSAFGRQCSDIRGCKGLSPGHPNPHRIRTNYFFFQPHPIQTNAEKAFAECLAHNKTLRVLRLNGNVIRDISSFGEALKVNTSLEELNLSSNKISDLTNFAKVRRCPLLRESWSDSVTCFRRISEQFRKKIGIVVTRVMHNPSMCFCVGVGLQQRRQVPANQRKSRL
jgi:Leucine-rich repeat (LRR) protein